MLSVEAYSSQHIFDSMPKRNTILLFEAVAIKWYAGDERQWMSNVGKGTAAHQHVALAHVGDSVGDIVVSHNVDGEELAFKSLPYCSEN